MLPTSYRLSALSRVAISASRSVVRSKNCLTPKVQDGIRVLGSTPRCQLSMATHPIHTCTLTTKLGLTSVLSARMGEFLGKPGLLTPPPQPSIGQARSVIKWSMRKGKRKSVKAVLKRFMRLHWYGRGIWIRARAGAKKRIWRKSHAQRRRCKTHVFCNATQSNLLDKMVTRYWKKMRYYPDDPYRPYMSRENYRHTQGYPRDYY